MDTRLAPAKRGNPQQDHQESCDPSAQERSTVASGTDFNQRALGLSLAGLAARAGMLANGSAGLFPPPALGERRHRSLGHWKPCRPISARSPACPVERDAGDSAERAGLHSSPDCQPEDALFAARPLQAWHLVLRALLFAVAATT